MKRAAPTMTFVVSLVAGCATAAPPKQAHIDASAAVRAAEEIIEADPPTPQAELYLSKARDHIRSGEELMERRNYQGARLHFERAEADAETSLALARAHRAEAEAQRAEARLEGFGVEEVEERERETEVEINVDTD